MPNRKASAQHPTDYAVYVVIVHRESGRAYAVDRGYHRSIDLCNKNFWSKYINNCPQFDRGVLYDPPEWAFDLEQSGKGEEFTAYWRY